MEKQIFEQKVKSRMKAEVIVSEGTLMSLDNR